MAEDGNQAAADAAAKAASDAAAAAAAKAASDKAAADAAAAEAAKAQQIPLDRFQAVVAQRAEAQRAAEALTRELKLANDTIEEFKALSSKGADAAKANGADAKKAPTPAELQELVRQEAQQLNFNERCNAVAAEGKKAHDDFDKVVLGDLTSVSPVLGSNGRPVLPVPLLEAALETGNAHEVLYELGKDVGEAARIMALRPVAQAVELAKFSAKLAAKAAEAAEPEVDEDGKPIMKNVSRAPAPIKAPTKAGPVRPAFKVEDTENFSTEEWIRQREKQIAENRARK